MPVTNRNHRRVRDLRDRDSDWLWWISGTFVVALLVALFIYGVTRPNPARVTMPTTTSPQANTVGQVPKSDDRVENPVGAPVQIQIDSGFAGFGDGGQQVDGEYEQVLHGLRKVAPCRYLTRLPGPIRLCEDLRIRHGHAINPQRGCAWQNVTILEPFCFKVVAILGRGPLLVKRSPHHR